MPKKLTIEKFIKRAKEIHGDKYNYSLVDYKNAHAKIKIICPTHGVFEQQPYSHLNGRGCPYCSIHSPVKKSTEEFIKKAKEVHGDKYDYSLVDYKNAHAKIKIICHKHGIFEQKANNHLNGQGCPLCYEPGLKLRKTIEQFIAKAKEVHGDKYDYSLVDYKNNGTKIKIICPEHGIFEQTPWTHLNGCGCPFCKESKGEKKIKTLLEKNGYVLNETYFREYKFKDCKDINPLPFDFYIPSKNLLIEYQGIQHYKPVEAFGGLEGFTKNKKHDKIKKSYAEKEHNFLEITYKDFNNIEKILNKKLGV